MFSRGGDKVRGVSFAEYRHRNECNKSLREGDVRQLLPVLPVSQRGTTNKAGRSLALKIKNEFLSLF